MLKGSVRLAWPSTATSSLEALETSEKQPYIHAAYIVRDFKLDFKSD